MKAELIKQFAKKTIIKIMIFVVFMIVITAISQSAASIISNEMARTQMENSNEMFVLMNTYNKVRPLINLVYVFIVSYFLGTVARDVRKFTKTLSAENPET